MAELKLCPFCGRIPMVEDCGDNRFFVRCKCGIAQDKLYGQRCDAVRRWNTRKPSADAVKIVRCKDCKWSKQHMIFGREVLMCKRGKYMDPRTVEQDGFCSYGERNEAS